MEPPPIRLVLPSFVLIIPADKANRSRVLRGVYAFNQELRREGDIYQQFTVPLDELPESVLTSVEQQQALTSYVGYLFDLAPLPEQHNTTALLAALSVGRLLECQELMCQRLSEIARLYFGRAGFDQLPDAEFMIWLFGLAPQQAATYLKQFSNHIYEQDSFNREILLYWQTLIQANEQYAYALQPHGYPFTRRERIDRLAPSLFLLDPLRNSPQVEDYMGADVVAFIEPDAYKNAPPPVELVTKELVVERISQTFPLIIRLNERLRDIVVQRFPALDAGFIFGGELFTILLDKWLFTYFNDKPTITLSIYGPTQAVRAQISELLFDELSATWEVNKLHQGRLTAIMFNGHHYIVTLLNDDRAHTPLEALMDMPLSSTQVGYDVHRGLVCSAAFSLYYRKRQDVILSYGVPERSAIKTLYRGFSLRVIAPYAYVLVQVSRYKRRLEAYIQETPLMRISNVTLIKGQPLLLIADPQAPRLGRADEPNAVDPRAFTHADRAIEAKLLGQWGQYYFLPYKQGGNISIEFNGAMSVADIKQIALQAALDRGDYELGSNIVIGSNVFQTTPLIKVFWGYRHLFGIRAADLTREHIIPSFFMTGAQLKLFVRNCRISQADQYNFAWQHNSPNTLIRKATRVFVERDPRQVENGPPPVPAMPAAPELKPFRQRKLVAVQTQENPGPLDHPEMLRMERYEYPVRLTGIIQLTGDPTAPEDLHEPLMLTAEEERNMITLDLTQPLQMRQVEDYFFLSNTEYVRQMLAYRAMFDEIRELSNDAFRMNQEDVIRRGDALDFTEQIRGMQAGLPRYIRIIFDVHIAQWMFLDEAHWLMSFQDMLASQLNCVLFRRFQRRKGVDMVHYFITQGFKQLP
jgi:hypothetical protein